MTAPSLLYYKVVKERDIERVGVKISGILRYVTFELSLFLISKNPDMYLVVLQIPALDLLVLSGREEVCVSLRYLDCAYRRDVSR